MQVQIYGGGSRERRHSAALEPLAQRGDAHSGVGAFTVFVFTVFVDAAERVVGRVKDAKRSRPSSCCLHAASTATI